MGVCKRISVVVPCRNEEGFIGAFLENMLSQDYPQDCLEIIIADGMSTDNTAAIVKGYQRQYPAVQLINNEKQTVPYALNKAIRYATGDIIVRADVHAIYPANYLLELSERLITLHADNVGGVCETLPADNQRKSRAIAIVMSNWFGVGNSYFRIGAEAVKEVDTVPFGCFHRALFDRIGFFDEELTRNQDDEFNGRIIKNGGKIYLLPHLKIQYFARDKVSKMLRMFYQYGLFKPLVNIKLGAPATLRQFAPLCFLLGLFFGGLLSCLSQTLFMLYGAVLCLYLVLGLYACKRDIAKDPGLLFYTPWLFLLIHLAYGWGYLSGIYTFNLLRKTTTKVDINR